MSTTTALAIAVGWAAGIVVVVAFFRAAGAAGRRLDRTAQQWAAERDRWATHDLTGDVDTITTDELAARRALHTRRRPQFFDAQALLDGDIVDYGEAWTDD